MGVLAYTSEQQRPLNFSASQFLPELLFSQPWSSSCICAGHSLPGSLLLLYVYMFTFPTVKTSWSSPVGSTRPQCSPISSYPILSTEASSSPGPPNLAAHQHQLSELFKKAEKPRTNPTTVASEPGRNMGNDASDQLIRFQTPGVTLVWKLTSILVLDSSSTLKLHFVSQFG